MCFCVNTFIFIVKTIKNISDLIIHILMFFKPFVITFTVGIYGLTAYVFWGFLNLANWCSQGVKVNITLRNGVYIIGSKFGDPSLFQLLPIPSYKRFFHLLPSYDYTFQWTISHAKAYFKGNFYLINLFTRI